MEGLYAKLAKASPTYAYTVGWQKYLLRIQELIIRAVPIAKKLGFIQETAAKTSNIFAISINRSFKIIQDAVSDVRFSKALAVNMVSFCELLPKAATLVMKLAKTITYLGVAIRNIPDGVKEFGGLIAKGLALTAALWGIKSALGLVIGMTLSAFRPAIALAGAFLSLGAASKVSAKGMVEAAGATKALSISMLPINPVALGLALAFAAIAASILVIIDNIDTLKDSFNDLGLSTEGLTENLKPLPYQILGWYTKIFPDPTPVWKRWYRKSANFLGMLTNDTIKSVAGGAKRVSKSFKGRVEGIIKDLTDAYTEGMSLAAKKRWEDYQKFLKGVQDDMASLTSGLEDEMDKLKTNVKSIYEKAIKSGDLSLATELVPYVKDETLIICHALENERIKILRAYIRTHVEQVDLRNKLKIRLEEIRIALKEGYDSIKDLKPEFIILPFEEKHYKATMERLKGVREEAKKLSESYKQIAEKAKPPIEQIHNWLDEQKKKIKGLGLSAKETAKLMGEATEAAKAKLQSLTERLKNKTKNTTTIIQDMWKQACHNMQDAFGTFFVDAVEGKLNSLKDYVLSFLRAVRNAMAQALGAQVGGAIMGGIGKFIGIPAPVKAASGVDFYTRGPTPIIAGEAGTEHVQITPVGKETKPSIQVNVINKGQPVSAKQEGMRFDGRQWVIDIVLDALNSQPSFRNAIRST